jgi:hypothetical protein
MILQLNGASFRVACVCPYSELVPGDLYCMPSNPACLYQRQPAPAYEPPEDEDDHRLAMSIRHRMVWHLVREG